MTEHKYTMPNPQAGSSMPCNCRGPQNGEPLCPCMMRNVIVRDGRYIRKEVDLGPVKVPYKVTCVITQGQGHD